MSLDALIWAVKDAPVADVEEHAVLTVLADEASEDGCNAFLATSTISRRARVHERTVQRRLDAMEARGLLGRGDQSRAAYIRADRRPVVYDLLIPFTAFANVDRVNQSRAGKGLTPLTPEARPNIAPPPPTKLRSDAGKKKPKKADATDDTTTSRTDSGDPQTASHPADGVTTSPIGLPVTDGVTTSPGRGDFKSPDPVLDPVIDPTTPSPPPSDAGEEEQEQDLPRQDRDNVLTAAEEALAVEAIEARPDWSPSTLREVLADPRIRQRRPEIVRLAVMDATRDPKTDTPNRLLYDLCPSWRRAARQLGVLPTEQPDPGRPAAHRRGDCSAGLCDGSGSYMETVQVDKVVAYRDGGPVTQPVDQVVRRRCTSCAPSAEGAA